MVVANKPVFSIIAKVRVMIVISGMGTLLRMATRWMLDNFAQRCSMGWSKFQGSDNAERLSLNSSEDMVPNSARRWASMVKWVTSPKPKSGSSSALKKEELTAVKICAVSAKLKLL